MTTANVNVRQILLKKGNTARSQTYTGAIGEITLDTDLNSIRVHNGVTAGGVNILATQAQIDALTSSISTITGLDANLVANIGSLLANAASQQNTINSLLANAASQQTQIANITTGTATFGNLIPTANVTYSLGSPTQQWKDLYVSSNTIYIAGIPLRVDTNGNLTINGNSVSSSNGSVTNTGDLAFIDNAMYNLNGAVIENADLTHGATSAVVVPSNGSAEPLQVNNFYGPVNVTSGPNSRNTKTWSFGTDGSLTFPLVNGQTQIREQRYGMGNVVAYNDGGWAIGVYDGADYGTEGMRLSPGIEGAAEVILPSNQDAATVALQINNYSGNVQVNANNNYWQFGADGSTNLPLGGTVNFGYGNAKIAAGMGFHIGSEEPVDLYAGLPSISVTATSVTEDGGPVLYIVAADFPAVGMVETTWTATINSTSYTIASIESASEGYYWAVSLATQTSFEYGTVATFTRPDAQKHWVFDTNGTLDLPDGGEIWFSYGYIDQDESIDGQALRVSGGNCVVINTAEDSTKWLFDNGGNLTLPQTNMTASPAPISYPGIVFTDGTKQITAYTGGVTGLVIDGGTASTQSTELNIDGGGA